MEIIHKNGAMKAGSHVDNGIAEGKTTVVECDPWNPPYPMYGSSTHKSYSEKIFLDTTRLLAKYTNNLVDEILNYIKDGKLLQTAVLLLAAQEQIRVGSSCNRNGNSAIDGFSSITARIGELIIIIKLEMAQSKTEMLDQEDKCEHLSSALLLVKIISQAGKALDSYMGTHQEVHQTKVLERVSQILNDYGFFPTGEGISIGNLCPYKWWPMPSSGIPKKHGNMVATEAAAEMPHLYPADKKVLGHWIFHKFQSDLIWLVWVVM
ncbi:hypothetical protein ACQ4PT_070771 [Festuca glaucescens]